VSFAKRYANDLSEPEQLGQEAANEYLKHPERYAIFIYHQRNLHADLIGEIYFNGRSMHKRAQSAPRIESDRTYLTAREYSILRHILKYHERADMRSLPDLVEHCWRDSARATDLREKYNTTSTKRDRYHELGAPVRGTISKLSSILHQFLGVDLRSNETGIYDIDPPCVFCVIEEL
jgi:hypothetical protein